MPVWDHPNDLLIDEDAVLRGQGAEPGAIRKRSPRLVTIAAKALAEGAAYLKPQVMYKKLKVKSILHESIVLENGGKLTGKLVVNHLGPAAYVVLLMCTVGNGLEEHVATVMADDLVYGLALDGFGSAAVEALANAACKFFEDEAKMEGYTSSIPISPGMIGWDVSKGQPELFKFFESSEINISLSPSAMMNPRKSLTMVLGFGLEMNLAGSTCDFCAMKDTCQYRDHYETIT